MSMLPYGQQTIAEEDVAAVVDALQSGWLTTGPAVAQFEAAFGKAVGARSAVAVSSGTAALHAAMYATGVGPGDEVIVPALTFVASANAVVYQGGRPVFADVDPQTLVLDPDDVARHITPRTRAIVAVDYAGQPCEYRRLRALARDRGLALIADACHALGGADEEGSVGTLADLSCFSLHPVKHITTGEGGVVVTDDSKLADSMRRFRNHGIATDHREREAQGTWRYDMETLGFNYRLTDFQCALGVAQLRRLPEWVVRRRMLASRYDAGLSRVAGTRALRTRPGVRHAYHLYVVRVDAELCGRNRDEVFHALRAAGIGVNVHYLPVHLHRFYRERFGTAPGMCPAAERASEEILSLPMFPGMRDEDVERVVGALADICGAVKAPDDNPSRSHHTVEGV